MAKRQSRRKAGLLGAILGLIGGVLIGVGIAAPWAQSEGISVGSVVIPGDVRGWESPFGLFALAAGISAIVLSLATFITPRRTYRLLGGGLVIAALVAGAVAIRTVVDLSQAYVDFAIARASDAGLHTSGVEPSIRELMELGRLDVDAGVGLWLAGAGVILILVGGSLMVISGPRADRDQDDMGFGGTG
jgi:hypothetical protein